ncbi:MAG: amino acid adenylation domain-containing protein [Pseudomonadota bacterium]|nr:amino acid adenylation domain-containing protein [Pseudomonadota bacterium]
MQLSDQAEEEKNEPRMASSSSDNNLTEINSEELIFPASFAQQRLWFLYRLQPKSPAYNIAMAKLLDGELNKTAIEHSIKRLVNRHESLRTRFKTVDDKPMQWVFDSLDIEINFDKLPGAEPKTIQKVINQLAQQPFNLEKEPLFRVHLFQKRNTHLIVIVIHHIIADAASLDILYTELVQLYNGYCDKNPIEMPELPIQYGDYTDWQYAQLKSGAEKKQFDYWLKKLTNVPELLDLPTDRPRPKIQTYSGETISKALDPDLVGQIKALVHQSSSTLFIIMLAAFAALLSKYSSSKDIIIGTPMSGRDREEISGVVGLFLNTLALRLDLNNNPSIKELIDQAQIVSLEALENPDVPFEKLVDELQPDRNMSHSPIFQTMLIVEQIDTSNSLSIHGLKDETVIFETKTAKFDLSLFISDSKFGTNVTFEYNSDLFNTETIASMLNHFEILLGQSISKPDTPIFDLSLVDDIEYKKLIYDFNNTKADYVEVVTVAKLFLDQVRRTPKAIALKSKKLSLSYSELDERANNLAATLNELGARPGEFVAICCKRDIVLPIAALACVKAGICYVPIDPNYPKSRIATILNDVKPKILLTQSSLKFPDCKSIKIDLDDYDFTQHKEVTSTPLPENPVYCIYTSGSTGVPKGVQLSQAALANLIQWQGKHERLGIPACTLQFTSFSFDVSFQEVFGTWCHGGQIVMLTESQREDFNKLAKIIEQEKIQRIYLPFAALQPLVEIWETKPIPLALTDVIVAGEQLKVTDAVRNLFARLSHAALHNQYGPSETHVVTALTLSGDAQEWPSLPSIGKPIANTSCYVLNQNLQPTPIGLPGELYLGGAQVAIGYLKRPELDEEKFIADPFVADGRLYKTGDLARYLENGELEFLGRVDDQFKWRGYRIEPGEIETALTSQKDVEDAVVIIRNDKGIQHLVAYVTGGNKQPNPDTLKQELKKLLPEYMQPSIIQPLDQMPLTPSGKIARRSLPAPDYNRLQTASFMAPRNPTEENLIDLFRQVLKLKIVSIHDNFFQLGGHSLLATQFIARVRSTLDIEASLIDLFTNPTVAEFGKKLDELRGIEKPPKLEPQNRTSKIPLSFAQDRLWFLDQLEPGNPVYNFPIVLNLFGKIDKEAMQKALDALIERHESFRTCFRVIDKSPNQVIHKSSSLELKFINATNLSKEKRSNKINDLIQEAFDITEAPLLRAYLLQSTNDEHTLILITHHIVSDGWSLGVMMNELSLLYPKFTIKKDLKLNDLRVQYADYALWQKKWFAGETLKKQLNYWLQKLENLPAALDIPTDWPRPIEQTFNGSGEIRKLSPKLLENLQNTAQSNGCTLYMLLLAAFDILLGRYSGSDDIVVGSPIAGRKMQETEGLIGFFSNTLVMRADLSGNPHFKDFLHQVRATTLEAHENQDLPFEKLVEELKPDRNLSHSPIFQVMLVLQNNPIRNVKFGDLNYSYPDFDMGISKFDLLLEITEEESGLRTGIQYNSDLFSSNTMKRILKHFEILLEAVCNQPEAQLSDLPLLEPEERERILNEFNENELHKEEGICVHDLVEKQVKESPNSTALTWAYESINYKELNSRANTLASHLISKGAGPGMIIAIASNRCLELPIAVLAVLKSGACYMPVDPTYPIERVKNMLGDSEAKIIISQSGVSLPKIDAEVIYLDKFDFSKQNSNIDNQFNPKNPLYCIYTSGSTGKPKGVQLSHAGLANLLLWQMNQDRLSKPAKTLQFASLSFDVSFQEIFGTWSTGGELVMIDDEMRQDLIALSEYIKINKIERLYLPFAAFQPIAAELTSTKESLQIKDVIVAGEQLQISEDVRSLFSNLSGAALHNQYGPSETHVVTALTLTGNPKDWPKLPSIGKPVKNTQCYVLDKKKQILPVGLPGELYLGGEQLAIGYLNRPEENKNKFLNSPFKLGQQLYKTGDRVRWLENGEIEFLGRADDQIKWRGFRIEPGEIETTLTNLKSIKQAVVLLREDQPGDKRLVAYVTNSKKEKIQTNVIREALRDILPEYMVPSPIIMIEALPLTPSGKIDRRKLPKPKFNRITDQKIVLARNTDEEKLLTIWKSLLSVSEISIHDNFFDLGGHSLLATQLIARIRDEFGISLPLKYIFRYPSPANLAETIAALKVSSDLNKTIINDDGYEEISI